MILESRSSLAELKQALKNNEGFECYCPGYGVVEAETINVDENKREIQVGDEFPITVDKEGAITKGYIKEGLFWYEQYLLINETGPEWSFEFDADLSPDYLDIEAFKSLKEKYKNVEIDIDYDSIKTNFVTNTDDIKYREIESREFKGLMEYQLLIHCNGNDISFVHGSEEWNIVDECTYRIGDDYDYNTVLFKFFDEK